MKLSARPKRRARALGQFDELALSGGDVGGFDWSAWDYALDSSLLDFNLDLSAFESPELAGDWGVDLADAGSTLTVPEFSLPDLSLSDFLKYGSQALSLYTQYEQVQAAKEGRAPYPGTTSPVAPTQPTIRQVTSPTGQLVTQRYNPATGQWTTITPTATGAQTQWIPGVPNVAVVGVGALAAFFALGSFGGKRR